MSERLIMPLAAVGIAVGLWAIFGWVVGLIACTVLLVASHEAHVAKRNAEWRERWETKEALWDAGDRRGKVDRRKARSDAL